MKSTIRTLGAITVAAAALLTAQPGHARQMCAPHDAAAMQLEDKFDEQVVGRGLTPNGQAMFELFVSETGSWTVLASDPQGRSCVIASGDSWHRIPLLVGDPA